MRKLVTLLFCGLLSLTAAAQNREINFEPAGNTLAMALKKAAGLNKLTFVDCYTNYCGPCRAMAATVFKTDSVADFFNKTFVNVKLDMMSKDGKPYNKTYAIGAVPTYLILTPDGAVRYKFVGGMTSDKFMAQIRKGLDPRNALATMDKTYASGRFKPDFLLEYIKAKVDNSEFQNALKLSHELTSKLTPQERAQKKYWYLYDNRWVGGVQTENFNYLVGHWADFVPAVGRDTVFSRIADVCRQTAEWVLQGWMWKDYPRTDTYYNKLSTQMMSIPMTGHNDLSELMQICAAAARTDSAEVRRLFSEHITNWNEDNQKALFGAMGYFYNSKTELHALIKKLLQQGRKNNLTDFLKSLMPKDEAYLGDKFSPENIRSHVGSVAAVPFFHPTLPLLWYVWEDKPGRRSYYSYSPREGKRRIYDQTVIDSLVRVLLPGSEKPSISYDPDFTDTGIEARLSVGGKDYIYDAARRTLTPAQPRRFKQMNPYGTAPDGRSHLIVKDGNLWQEDINPEDAEKILYGQEYRSSNVRQLTHDAAPGCEFVLADMEWLTDSTYYITRTDTRGVRKFPIVFTTSFAPPSVREYDYELPGDTVVARRTLYVGNIRTGRLTPVCADKWPCQELEVMKVPDVHDRVYFLRRRKTRDELELCTADAATGRVKVLVNEVSRPYISPDLFSCKVLNRGRDILLWSDRSGWGHYYHYDGTGRLLGAMTSGNWTAGRIVRVDTTARRVFFYGYGREKNRMPSAAQLYSVDMNGSNLRLLTPENADHSVFVSNDGSLLFDNYSRIDTVPLTAVRSARDGRVLATLEHARLDSLMAYGWRFPETFKVKAADGKTDLYGIMWKPYDFDPAKKYPVISQVYPGPFTDTVWPSFQLTDKYNNATLAQAGFIVVVTGHRGSSPYRGKAYATYGYGNLRDYPLADDVAALRQLAARYPFIDLSRAGIVGHSGGAMMAVAALCTYPEVYKAAVASSGNYDNRIYNRMWGETYQGVSSDKAAFKVDLVTSLVPSMRGALLLATGETDENVHPAHTMRLVDELIREDKPFELLVLPAQGHHYDEPYNTYFEHRKRDFFIKNLNIN